MDDRSSETTFQVQQNSTISHSILSADLLEVPVIYEIQQHELERLKNRPQGNHQEALATILAQAAQLNSPGVPSSSMRSLPMPVTPTVNADRAEADKTETTGSKSLSASQSGNIPNDIYSWRKYGRIQLKSPEGSRSYYKCTYSACNAKKIESCDQFNSVPKIVYKGQHQHDATKRVVSSGDNVILTRQSLKRKSISTQGLNADVEDVGQKDTMGSKSLSASQSGKIPNDIYSWRKYGRIQLKSPEGLRSYYKCTYSSCNAKKIESCDQFTSVPKIVYKGQHQHDATKRVVSSGGNVRLTRQSLKRKSISTKGLNADVEDVGQKDTMGSKSLSASQSGKIPNDIYSWRKYGRTQLKSPEGFRSYYKCTYSACNAKKIESYDQFNSLPRIVYKGQHKHDASKRVVLSGGEIRLTRQSLKRKSISTHGLNADVEDVDQKDIMGSKSLSASQSGKIPNDIYNWRQYGRIQLKSPKGSRSYYKCKYGGCNAKKIVSCDQSNSIPKIVYKGEHRHDTPKRVLLRRGKMMYTPKSSKGKSISSHGFKEHRVEHFDASRQKQRVKKSSSAGSVTKQPKKPEFIVHAASDIEISADGYNWKKYGQMMVKGNAHLRNYYKCTSAGCTVEKHIEKVNGSSQVIITYRGVHNHNVPVSKRR